MANRILTRERERELIAEFEDGWTIRELTIIYRVSVRTVYRTLAYYHVPLQRETRKKRKPPPPPKIVELKPCGTNAAYQRHRRKGEYPCSPCLEAHTLNVLKYKKKPKKKGAKNVT